ncbi:MAG: alpha-L-arabinofuranosidase C-terminal domain-containing protein, partial [bacterium]
AENGDPEPFNVKYWGLGNENWGGGGNFTPEDYCTEFRRVTTIVKSLDRELKLIACGAGCGIGKDDTEWTRRFFEKLQDTVPPGKPVHFYGYAIHYYCGSAGTALEFDVNQWYELLYKASYMENIIERHRKIMDVYDPERKINLIVDEWGCWHPEGSGPSKGKNLFEQQSTMRDALVAGITLNIFNNHADKIVMANIAQLVNCLQSLFLANEENFILTPNYFVFDMYKAHQKGLVVRTVVEAEDIIFPIGDKEARLSVLNCSASIKDDKLTLTIINNHFSSPCEIRLILVDTREGKIIRRVTLSAEDPHMYNDFDHPDRIKPTEDYSEISGKEIILEIPKASINLIEIELR